MQQTKILDQIYNEKPQVDKLSTIHIILFQISIEIN